MIGFHFSRSQALPGNAQGARLRLELPERREAEPRQQLVPRQSLGTRRNAFTLLETMVALGVLGTAATIAAQIGTWSLIERAHASEQLAATDAVANILEAARARSWSDLTPEWAAAQKLPDAAAARLADGVLAVRVVPEPDRPHVKRVTVTIEWDHQPSIPVRTVTLIGLFAERSAGGGS